MEFPKGFLWGAATAAYQIEGASGCEFRGRSIWDTFCNQPGKIKNGDSGFDACDHYHRYKEDIALMKSIGLNAYRFSISWPRVLPEGTGRVNEMGLDFYDRLTDELLGNGIQPCATLFHWDFPQALYDRGGWLNNDVPEWFAEYTSKVASKLGDRICCWMTFNEMMVVVDVAHRLGTHAPGENLSASSALAVLKNMLLSHGRSVQVLRAALPPDAQIGIAHTGLYYMPASRSREDYQGACDAQFQNAAPSGLDTGRHSLYLDPILLGAPVSWGENHFGADWVPYTASDLNVISQPIDFLGLNCYWATPVRAGENGKPEPAPFTSEKKTHFNWAVTPDALYWAVKIFHERYKKPILITENGMSNDDSLSDDGCVHDPERIEFLRGYLQALRRAMEEGVPVTGYLQWSLLDNFEWAAGFAQRFGLVYVDYQTQKRTMKDSAHWYRQVIAENGSNL